MCRDTHDISENVIQEMSHILKNNISLILFYGSDFFTDYDLIFLFFKTHVTDPKRRLEDGFMFVLVCAGVR